MDFVLNRRGGVPVRDQLIAQLEMKILDGSLAAGQRLPSVRALARRLDVHANTVSAAYRDLEAAGVVRLQRGSGVFVQERGSRKLESARGLDEMLRLALYAALRKGYSGVQIRTAVERWLAAAPPDRVEVVDPKADVAELLAAELREALRLPVSSCTTETIAREPGRLVGALAVTSPYHAEALREAAPGAALEVVNLEASQELRETIRDLAAGSIVLVVSASPTVLPFASTLLRSLRGDELLVETRLLSATREWRRLNRAADLLLTDLSAADAVARAKPRRIHVARLIARGAVAHLRAALTVVVPSPPPPERKRKTRRRE